MSIIFYDALILHIFRPILVQLETDHGPQKDQQRCRCYRRGCDRRPMSINSGLTRQRRASVDPIRCLMQPPSVFSSAWSLTEMSVTLTTTMFEALEHVCHYRMISFCQTCASSSTCYLSPASTTRRRMRRFAARPWFGPLIRSRRRRVSLQRANTSRISSTCRVTKLYLIIAYNLS